MTGPLGMLKRGLNRPDRVPRYLLGLVVPSTRLGPTWRRRDGVVVFEPGGYVTSARDRPEFAANLYHEVRGLRATLDAHLDGTPTRSLEVGCGYGRLSPWIAEHSEKHYGVDPDGAALARAGEQYPWIAFREGRAGDLPFADDAFDLVVTWTVLQHVDERSIREAADELRRVLAPGGVVVCCERTRPPRDHHLWPRSVESYARLFEPLDLVSVADRPVEPTWGEAMESARPAESVLAFRG